MYAAAHRREQGVTHDANTCGVGASQQKHRGRRRHSASRARLAAATRLASVPMQRATLEPRVLLSAFKAHLHFRQVGVPAEKQQKLEAASLCSKHSAGDWHEPQAAQRTGMIPRLRTELWPHLFSLSAHSPAIISAPLLLPLATVTIVMGMGRTDRASGFCEDCPAAATSARAHRRCGCRTVWCTRRRHCCCCCCCLPPP